MNSSLSHVRELEAMVLPFRMGELILSEKWTMHHFQDAKDNNNLRVFQNAHDAQEIAKYDAQGKYRPLKTAPDLKRGWILRLDSAEASKLALNFFYPAMWGTWLTWRKGSLHSVDLRETLERQSGMYRVTRNISNEQAGEVISETCNSEHGCLRKILWKIKSTIPHTSLPANKFSPDSPAKEVPLLCAEGCNFLVAAARKKVKG
ncbi:MAG: DR2241 family protein, partial [Chthoniobacterales bacterium]